MICFRKFDYEISRAAQNNSAIAGYLKTDCGADDICAGTLFPALAQRFPEGEVIIKSHTVSYPRIILNEGDASIYIDSRVDAFVQQGDRTRRFLTSAMEAEAKLEKLSSTDSLTFNLRTHLISIPLLALTSWNFQVASLVEGIDESSLEFLVNALTELILNEDLAKKLKGGQLFSGGAVQII
ncbi:unnamed protein product [Haemonchus placei]|uniref:Lipid-binding serum glycoprotein C-terminal domain-containing protein n=1 Tax=Haemonchus placei TaxID=6290 RepID=A0A3P7V446_HAEPC|nr:unnamed protein product [Haemonchus placei]